MATHGCHGAPYDVAVVSVTMSIECQKAQLCEKWRMTMLFQEIQINNTHLTLGKMMNKHFFINGFTGS
jgi:hypothetical protein